MTNYDGRFTATLFGLALLGLTLFSNSALRGQISLAASLNDGDARIEAGLAKRITLQCVDMPLKELVQFVSDQSRVRMVLSKKIEDAGVSADHPVTFAADNIATESALRLILRELNLSFLVQHERVIITTIEDSQSPANQTTHAYLVADLLDVVRLPAHAGGGLAHDYDSLIETITSSIEPDSWSDVGGPGSIREFENSRSLVISTRRDLHQRIAALLVSLRKAKGLQGIRSTALPAAGADAAHPAMPLRLSTPLPTTQRDPAARIRVRPSSPLPGPTTLGGGQF
jgi:hypothetical protein